VHLELECRWTLPSKYGSEDPLASVWQRKLQPGNEQLPDIGTTNVCRLDLLNADDVDRREACAMARRHVLVTGIDSIDSGQLAILLVHVMCARTRVISNPDAKILDLERLPLAYLADGHDLTGGLLDLLQLLEEVPEAALGNDSIGTKNPHLVQLRHRLLDRGTSATNNKIFASGFDMTRVLAHITCTRSIAS